MVISLYGLQNIRMMKNKITFAREDQEFIKCLNLKVESYFRNSNQDKYGNSQLHVKALGLFALYVFVYMSVYFYSNLIAVYVCYAVMGPLTVFLALNIGHEAAHNIFCKSKKMNSFLVFVFDLMGASSQVWIYKHVHSHHKHTNIHKEDLELEQPSIVRIFPQSAFLFFHKYQQYYMPFLYCIYTLIWFCIRDYNDFFKLRSQMSKGKPMREMFVFFLYKFVFILRMLILPAIVLPFSWLQIGGAFLLCNIVSSITVTFALISTHVGEHSEFPEPDEEDKLNHSWVRHQFKTTSDFSTDSLLVTELYGGFNHHLTHHLFPFVSHVHYPELTRIIREVSKEYNFVTFPQPTIGAAIASHFRFLGERARQGEIQPGWMEM